MYQLPNLSLNKFLLKTDGIRTRDATERAYICLARPTRVVNLQYWKGVTRFASVYCTKPRLQVQLLFWRVTYIFTQLKKTTLNREIIALKLEGFGKCLVVQFGRVSLRGKILGSGGVGHMALMQVLTLWQFCQDLNEVVQSPEVAILSVPFYPGHVVLEDLSLWQWCGFPKVDHPDFGLFFFIMNEEQGAPNHLQKEDTKLFMLQLFLRHMPALPYSTSFRATLSNTLPRGAPAILHIGFLHEQNLKCIPASCVCTYKSDILKQLDLPIQYRSQFLYMQRGSVQKRK